MWLHRTESGTASCFVTDVDVAIGSFLVRSAVSALGGTANASEDRTETPGQTGQLGNR